MNQNILNSELIDTPLISVAIPVYNGDNYLREAIDSVLAQTYTNYEIIVVDDGSTDNTWDIIQSYGSKVRGFKKENGGVSTALNYAITQMKGEWFAWLSHDDLWMPEKLERQVLYINENPDVKLCYSGFELIDKDGNKISEHLGVWFKKGKDIRYMVLCGPYINGITTLLHRSCFIECGLFREDLRCVQDADMWVKIARRYHLGLVPFCLAKTRCHNQQIGQLNSSKCQKEYLYLFKGIVQSLTPEDVFPDEVIGGDIGFKTIVKCFLFKSVLCLYHSIHSIPFIWSFEIFILKYVRHLQPYLSKII